MDELPLLYLEEEEVEPWWMVERETEDAWWLVDLDSTCNGDLANKEEFAWPLFRFTWRDFLPGQRAKIYLAVARKPLPSLLEVVDGEQSRKADPHSEKFLLRRVGKPSQRGVRVLVQLRLCLVVHR